MEAKAALAASDPLWEQILLGPTMNQTTEAEADPHMSTMLGRAGDLKDCQAVLGLGGGVLDCPVDRGATDKALGIPGYGIGALVDVIRGDMELERKHSLGHCGYLKLVLGIRIYSHCKYDHFTQLCPCKGMPVGSSTSATLDEKAFPIVTPGMEYAVVFQTPQMYGRTLPNADWSTRGRCMSSNRTPLKHFRSSDPSS